jgi:hypothetical protein
VNGQIRITEQGEIISSKYSNPEVGRSNLEILAAATLEASLLHPRQSAPRKEYLTAMEQLSALAFKAYRGLVYETEGFADYFWGSTVITEISTLNIGSRPASRKKTREIEDLRAIPWVFSWAQCRLMLPGWYGFGSAVETWIAEHPEQGMPFLQELYREWPFFRTLLLDPQPLPLSRSAQPRAGGIAERAPRAEPRRAGAARDSADDQRDLGGAKEQRVRGRHSLRRRPGERRDPVPRDLSIGQDGRDHPPTTESCGYGSPRTRGRLVAGAHPLTVMAARRLHHGFIAPCALV